MLAVVPLQSAHVTPARPFTADARVRGGALAAAAAAAAACSGALVISDALGRGSLRSAMVPAPRVSRCCALSWQCRAPETRARASYLLPLGFRTIQQLFWPVSARAAIYWATSWCLMQRTSDTLGAYASCCHCQDVSEHDQAYGTQAWTPFTSHEQAHKNKQHSWLSGSQRTEKDTQREGSSSEFCFCGIFFFSFP